MSAGHEAGNGWHGPQAVITANKVVDGDHAVAVDIAGHRSGFPCVQIVAVAGLGMRVRMVSLLL